MNLQDQIREYTLSKPVAPAGRRVGVEEECILYTPDLKRLKVNPGGTFSATDLLSEMKRSAGEDETYTLEPGGQIEWSSPPHADLHELSRSFGRHHTRLKKAAELHDFMILDLGVDPLHEPEEIDLIDQKKYQLMDRHMEKVGTLGKWMMRNTTSIQLNFDIIDRQDAEEMLFLADALQPVAAWLFANSPFWKGEAVGDRNLRYEIWEMTDPKRCRNLIDQGITRQENLVSNFIDYIQTVPGIFQLDESGQPEATTGTLGDRLARLENEGKLNNTHIQAALRQIFTNVRLKTFVEVRGADRPPAGFEMAPVAFWTGLLMSESSRKNALQEARKWSLEDRHAWNKAAYRLDPSQMGPAGKSYGDWNRWAADLALEGLSERNNGEEPLLEPFLDTIFSNGPFTLQTQALFREGDLPLGRFLQKRIHQAP